jgi:hypothetical protein
LFPGAVAIDGMEFVDWNGIYERENWLLIWSFDWEARLYILVIGEGGLGGS